MDAMQKINGITSALLNELNEIEDEAQGNPPGHLRQGNAALLFPEFVRLYPNVHIDLVSMALTRWKGCCMKGCAMWH